jgi:naphthoate synthase
VSDNPFDPALWEPVAGFDDLTDITYHRLVADGAVQPTVRVAFNRPHMRNAFGRAVSTSCTGCSIMRGYQ